MNKLRYICDISPHEERKVCKMRGKKYPSILYEPEDDVLNIWLSKKPIDDSIDENGMIVHYSKDHEPVYLEILFAKRFFRKDKKTDMPKNIRYATGLIPLDK